MKALQEYKSGERKHPSMRAIAAPLSEQDMADLAALLRPGRRQDCEQMTMAPRLLMVTLALAAFGATDPAVGGRPGRGQSQGDRNMPDLPR